MWFCFSLFLQQKKETSTSIAIAQAPSRKSSTFVWISQVAQGRRNVVEILFLGEARYQTPHKSKPKGAPVEWEVKSLFSVLLSDSLAFVLSLFCKKIREEIPTRLKTSGQRDPSTGRRVRKQKKKKQESLRSFISILTLILYRRSLPSPCKSRTHARAHSCWGRFRNTLARLPLRSLYPTHPTLVVY